MLEIKLGAAAGPDARDKMLGKRKEEKSTIWNRVNFLPLTHLLAGGLNPGFILQVDPR